MPPPTAHQDDLEGQTIAGCTFGRRLGRGRTGNVYEAHYEPVDKTVAVKVLRGDEARQPELREAFLLEARAIAALDHEAIVKILDVLETEDTVLIVMERLEGRNVWERLQDDARFPAEKAARIALQVAQALDAAHEQKLVHRDVKPQNVIVLSRDRVKVVDFGLAALPGTGGDRVGTPHYMAPEQASRARVDGAADIYGLGAMLYHMLTGKTPYQGKTVGEILNAHKEGKLVPPAQVEARVPAALDTLVRQMMAPAKGYRPSAADVVKGLEEFLAEGEWRRRRSSEGRGAGRRGGGRRTRGHAQRGEGAERPERERRPRSSAGLIVGLAVGLCVILVAVIIVMRMQKKDDGDAGDQTQQQQQPDYQKTPPPPPKPVDDAQVRAERSEAAYREAREWGNRNPGNKQGLVEQLRQVNRDYPGTSAGRRAGREAADLQASIDSAGSAESPVGPTKPDKPRVSLNELRARLKATRKLTGQMRVEEAGEAVKKLLTDASGTELRADAQTEEKALAWVGYLRQEMAGALESMGGVDYRKVKPLHPAEDALVIGIDEKGLKIREGGSESTVAWADLMGGEIKDLALACLPMKDRPRFALGVFLVRAGLRSEAEDEFGMAKMLSRGSGEYDQLIEELGK